MTKIHCPNCGAVVSAKNINIQSMMAVCDQCDSVFKFGEDVVSKVKQRKVKTPEKFNVIEEDGRFEINYLYRQNLGDLEYVILSFSMLGVLGGSAVALATLSKMFLVAAIAGLIALFALYVIVAHLIDRAHMVIDDEYLQFYEKPLYGFSNKKFHRDEVVRVISKPLESSPDTYHAVYVEMIDGSQLKYIDYTRRDIALYLVKALNDYLQNDIADTFVDDPAASTERLMADETIPDTLAVGDDGELIKRAAEN